MLKIYSLKRFTQNHNKIHSKSDQVHTKAILKYKSVNSV